MENITELFNKNEDKNLLGFIMGALIAAIVAIIYYKGQIQQLIEDYATQQNTIVIQ